jgi:integral membrane sensor domain MASE1
VVPLLWLVGGFVLARVYVRGLIFPGDRLAPVPIYVSEAIILAALLLTPQRRWWLYLAVYYVSLTVDRVFIGNTALGYVLLSNTVNVVQPLIGAALVRHFVRSPQLFDSLRNVAIYLACITTAELIGSLWGASLRALFMGAPFWPAWRGWFVGNLVAGLMLTPTLVLWVTVDRRNLRAQFARRWAEVLALGFGLLVVSWLIFGTETLGPDLAPQLLYLPVPFLLWAAVRFGPRGISAALSFFTVLTIAGVANQLGPFVGIPEVASVFQLQSFLLGVGVPLFCLAVLVQERTQSEGRYRAVVSNLPGGAVFLFGSDCRHLFADGEGLAQLGLTRKGVEGRTPAELFPPELAAS